MAKDNVIDLASKRKGSKKPPMRGGEARLFKLGCDLDALITAALKSEQLGVKEVAGVFAHRFGSLLGCVDKKEELWEVCKGIIKRQAKIKDKDDKKK